MSHYCHVYGHEAPPAHTCVVGVCVEEPPAPTVKITLPRPILDSPMFPPTGPTEPVTGYCEKHGTGWLVDAGSSPGFTGAGIYWERLSCGCIDVDQSADTIEAVR